jgi:hypothetical protein
MLVACDEPRDPGTFRPKTARENTRTDRRVANAHWDISSHRARCDINRSPLLANVGHYLVRVYVPISRSVAATQRFPLLFSVVKWTASTQYVSAPNSKPHLVLARRTIVNSDVRIVSFRQRVDTCNMHLRPAPAFGKFSEAGHRQSLKR